MSYRQKTFNQQDHSARSRARRWRRHPANAPPSGPILPKSPLEVSATTKSKLKAFQFTHPSMPPTRTAGSMDVPTGEDRLKVRRQQPKIERSPKDSLNRSPCAPQTPANRLPLAQLLGNNEDGPSAASKISSTPDEQVYWKQIRSPNSSASIEATPVPSVPRGQKRARTSSPLSSPHEHPESSSDIRVAPDPQAAHAQESFKKQQTDPAAELWDRYSVTRRTGDRSEPCADPFSACAHLFDGCSPRPKNGDWPPGAAAGLKRSASCGIEWPTSLSNRKLPLGANSVVTKGPICTLPKVAEELGKSRLSKVNFLVERVQESLSKPATARPSSSLPVPRRNRLTRKTLETIANDSSTDEDVKRPRTADPPSKVADGAALHVSGLRNSPQESSSEFGDLDAADFGEAIPDAVDFKAGAEASEQHLPLDPGSQGRIHVDAVEEPKAIDDDFFASDLDDDLINLDDDEAITESTGTLSTGMAHAHSSPKKCQNMSISPSRTRAGGTRRDDEKRPASSQESEDEFGDLSDFDIDFATAEAAVTSKSSSPPHSQLPTSRQVRAIERYLITSVAEGQYENHAGQVKPEKVLLVRDEKTKVSKGVTLRQSWFDSPCAPGAFIHVIGDFDYQGQCVIDDDKNMLILHPDHLISATVVADSFGCTRRAVLQDRVKATNEPSEPQVYGHILHEIFQEAMRANRWDIDWLQKSIEEIAIRYIEDIAVLRLEIHHAVAYLTSKLPQLQAWAALYVSAKPQAGATVSDRNGGKSILAINKLLDVEEHVWSPMYGLKGNIDATIQVSLKDGDGVKTVTVPLEVKTGKNTTSASHRAQTALYTLLLSDRYDIEIAYGILYYMETSEVIRVPAIRHELRQMVMQRNRLSCYVRNRLELPPMLKNPSTCNRCYAKVACLTYHKLVDDGNGETSGLKDKFDAVVRHLNARDQAFFKRWDDLLTKEEAEMLRFRRELWTMLSVEREKIGRCFANVVIEPGSASEDLSAHKINRFQYTFLKPSFAADFSFVGSQIAIGEPIVISDEKGHFALANGYVSQVRKHRITVAVDRRLHNARIRREGFDMKVNQTFAGIMEVTEDGAPPSTLTGPESNESTLYRLDKDEFSNGMATVRNNLIQVMNRDMFGSRTIRRLIVDDVAPRFVPSSAKDPMTTGPGHAELNGDQTRAITKVMEAQDYALVLGMPGTGKTTTIAHIIRALVSQGKSVLLTSYTHTAVDNILLKIRHDGIPILRLGAPAKVHPEVREFVTLAAEPKTTVEELHNSYQSPSVVATTCLGVNHAVFRERIFDYCIVDEASQITLPVCLGPIRMAQKFVLVGDHNQLPPLVQNSEAREGGLDISLFKLLSEKHPDSVVNLEHQYRMCEDIMALSNTLIYSGRLKCGSEAVASKSLIVPRMESLSAHHISSLIGLNAEEAPCIGPSRGNCWLRDLLEPSVKACFIDTDSLLPESREEARGSRIVNQVEAAITQQLVDALLTTGIEASSIGVISVYRSQLSILKHRLRHRQEVEMHTADKFQGRDKDVVILSLVRSNETGNVGDLLKDWRRVNVALTRARSKLLILGSRSTLQGNDLLGKLLDLMQRTHKIYKLPRRACDLHCFDENGTQSSVLPDDQSKLTATSGVQGKATKPKVLSTLKENVRPDSRSAGKVGRVSERVLLGSRPVLQDIFNDLS
ncbi:MAG: hypothetical protein M1825_003538 [Sarcosagium campestre]|nr:MAG: hypothetical protein M1825_003538 [Sarcosagium campestre]